MTARSAELTVNARSEGKLGVICSRLSIISYRKREFETTDDKKPFWFGLPSQSATG
jgi:hypothetical protein